MGWDGEADFKHALRQVARSATRDRLELVAIAAVEEEEVAYKVVAHLLLKTLKEVKPDSRLRVFYGLSAVARQSVARRGAGSKYVRRLEPQLDAVATLLGEAPDKDRALVARVLELWWREGVFSPPAVAKLQAQFPAAAAAAPAAAAAQAPPAAAVHVAAAGGNEEEQYVLPTQYGNGGAPHANVYPASTSLPRPPPPLPPPLPPLPPPPPAAAVASPAAQTAAYDPADAAADPAEAPVDLAAAGGLPPLPPLPAPLPPAPPAVRPPAVDGATSLSFGGQDEGPEAKKRKTRWESTGGTP